MLSSILARRWDLPPAQTRAVVREQKLSVPMDDGTVLLADRWVAEANRDKPQPTVLVRSCYGRGGPMACSTDACWPSAACRR